MRILYIHQYFSTPLGATGTRSYSFATELASRGHEVTVLCAQSSSGESGLSGNFRFGRRQGSVGNFTVVEFRGQYSNEQSKVMRSLEFVSFAARASLEVLSARRFDIVFASSTPLTVAIPALISRVFRRRPFIFEVRDSWPDILIEMGVLKSPWVVRLAKLLETAAYTTADSVIVLAPSTLEHVSAIRKSDSRVHLIPNGSDVKQFIPKIGADTDESKKFSLLNAVYSGTHGLANGLHFLLTTAQILEQRGIQEVKFHFFGEGSKKKELVSRAHQKRLSNVTFNPAVPKSVLAKILPSMSVGLQILEQVDGFRDGASPNKFFDYLASGLPVILNYPGWIGSRVEAARCGWVVQSPTELADLLVHLSRNPLTLVQYGRRSRALAEVEFNRANHAVQFAEIVEGRISA